MFGKPRAWFYVCPSRRGFPDPVHASLMSIEEGNEKLKCHCTLEQVRLKGLRVSGMRHDTKW